MSNSREHQAGGERWKIRVVQALDDDPMFHAARFLFAAESESSGFEVSVVFAPIYFHLASSVERLGLADTAAQLVEHALDAGYREGTCVRVSSDGVARVGEARLLGLFSLAKPEPPALARHA